MKNISNLNLINWTIPSSIFHLKKYSKIDEKIYRVTKNIFNYLVHNRYAIAVGVWSCLFIEVAATAATLIPVNVSEYGLEFCQDQFCNYLNVNREDYDQFALLMEFRCNSSDPEYRPFSSHRECTDHFYEYVTILQNSNEWLKVCQDQLCTYWNDSQKTYIGYPSKSKSALEFRCNSSHPEYQPYSSYHKCMDDFYTYVSSIKNLQNWLQTCQRQFCEYSSNHSINGSDYELSKKIESTIQSRCNVSYPGYSPFSSLRECMYTFYEQSSISEQELIPSELLPLDQYWQVYCPTHQITNWKRKKIARYMAKCFKKLCHNYESWEIDLDKNLYEWCIYENKTKKLHKPIRNILKKIKALETEEWDIKSIIGILISSFEDNLNKIYSILGSLITETSHRKPLRIPDLSLLKTRVSEIISTISQMVNDLIHIARIRGENLPPKLIKSLLEVSSGMEEIIS